MSSFYNSQIAPSTGSIKVYADTDQAESSSSDSGINPWLASILNPSDNDNARIPDENSTPIVLEKERISATLSGSSEYVLLYMPYLRSQQKVLVGKSVTDPIDNKVKIGFGTALSLDNDVGLDTIGGRVVSAALEIFTSTRTTTLVDLDGKVDIGTFESHLDLNSFDPASIAAYARKPLRSVMMSDGVIGLAFPSATEMKFMPYASGARIPDTREVTGSFIFSNFNAAPFNDPTNNTTLFDTLTSTKDHLMGHAMWLVCAVKASITLTTASPLSITLAMTYLADDGTRKIGSSLVKNISTTGVPVSVDFDLLTNRLYPCTQVAITLSHTVTSHQGSSVYIYPISESSQNTIYPITVARITSMPTTASLNVMATENHEIIPNFTRARLSRPERGLGPNQQPDDFLMTMNFIRKNPMAKENWTRSDYKRMLQGGYFDKLTSRSYLRQAYAFSFGDLWNSVKSIGKSLLPMVPSFLRSTGHPTAANIVTSLNPLLGAADAYADCASYTMNLITDKTLKEAQIAYGKEFVVEFNKKIYRKIPIWLDKSPEDKSFINDSYVLTDSDYDYFRDIITKQDSKSPKSPLSSSSTSSSSSSSTTTTPTAYCADMKTDLTGLSTSSSSTPVVKSVSSTSFFVQIAKDEPCVKLPASSYNFLDSNPSTIAHFANFGEHPTSSFRACAFAYLESSGGAGIAQVIFTQLPVKLEGLSVAYRYTRQEDLHVSVNYVDPAPIFALCKTMGVKSGYITVHCVNSNLTFRGRSLLGATLCALKGIPVNGIVSADINETTLEVGPIKGFEDKLSVMKKYPKLNFYVAATDSTAETYKLVPVSMAAFDIRNPNKVFLVRSISDLILIPSYSFWRTSKMDRPLTDDEKAAYKTLTKRDYEEDPQAAETYIKKKMVDRPPEIPKDKVDFKKINELVSLANNAQAEVKSDFKDNQQHNYEWNRLAKSLVSLRYSSDSGMSKTVKTELSRLANNDTIDFVFKTDFGLSSESKQAIEEYGVAEKFAPLLSQLTLRVSSFKAPKKKKKKTKKPSTANRMFEPPEDDIPEI